LPVTPAATTAPSCALASNNLVGAVQRYVDAYGAPLSSPSRTGSSGPSATPASPNVAELKAAIAAAQQAIRATACDLAHFRRSLESHLSTVTARGPVAKAVLLRLTATITGTAQQAAATITVKPDEDLPRRIADLAPGSTIQLTRGTYRLNTPLAVLDGITVQGAGRKQTVIRTTASDAALLVLTDARVGLTDLTLLHAGSAVADMVVGGPTSLLVVTRARISGAVGVKSKGGNGVLMSARGGGAGGGATTFESTDAIFDHNAAAGVSLGTGQVASIRQARFASNANCGICFSGDSTGAVRASIFVDNRVGAAALDRAKPALAGDTFDGGLFGIQASGQATPVITGATVSGASRAAIIFADRSAGRVDRSRCKHVPYGIVVAPAALPLLGTNSCMVAKGR
jgi:hypothetical protein